MLKKASLKGWQCQLIEYEDADVFSRKALQWFGENQVLDVILFYTRRIANPLIDQLSIYNIHPSLLPSYPGLHGLEDSFSGGAARIGATLHRVDQGLDTGPVYAQVYSVRDELMTLNTAKKWSYLHKVYLALLWVELVVGNRSNFSFDLMFKVKHEYEKLLIRTFETYE